MSVAFPLATILRLAPLLGFDARISMALHAVLEVRDAFLDVLRPDLRLRVLVAAVAGVAAVVVVLVAGLAGRLVVAVEHEVLVVVEGRRLPGLGLVARLAAALDLAMQPVGRRVVAALAAIQRGLGQQRVVEVRRLPGLALVALSRIRP